VAVSVRIDLNYRQINRILRSPTGLTARNMLRRGRKVQRHARRNVRSRSGKLARSIEVRLAMQSGAPGVEVYTDVHYALWVHNGTGVHGPRGRPFGPRRAKYMVFRGSDGTIVRTRSVRGQTANPFLRDALHSAL
jgi:hypothetical protein